MVRYLETPIIEKAGMKCRIQFRETESGWQQRHIWYRYQPQRVERTYAERWIRSAKWLVAPDAVETDDPDRDLEE